MSPQFHRGQALIEGVMMRGKDKLAMAVRKPDGDIEVKIEPLKKTNHLKFLKWPVIRGIVALISSMIVGVRALTYSAEFSSKAMALSKKGGDLALLNKIRQESR